MMFVSQGGAVKTPMVSDVDWRACRHGSDYDDQQPSSARDPKRMSVAMAARCADALGITLDEFHRSL